MSTKEIFLSTPLSETGQIIPKGANQVLMSVHPEYKRKKTRRIRESISARRVAYDSGGFQFLMRDLPLPTVEKVVATMQRLGMTPDDIAIQLDLPTNPHHPPEKRLSWIRESAELYHRQSELHSCYPVVHGWEQEEMLTHMELLGIESKVATGAWIAASTRGVAIASGSAEEKVLHVPVARVYTRLGILLRLLQDYDLFVLGAGSVNMCHLVWAHGARLTDGASWRYQAKNWQVMMPESSCKGFGSKRKTGVAMKDRDWERLREIKEMPGYPLQSLSIPELDELFKANGSIGFRSRAAHNAFVMLIEEEIANQFVTDPDAYYEYLLQRWERSPYWMKRLKLVREQVQTDYVQTSLELYLKGGAA